MKIYALIGPSGSGKSHRSTLVAYRRGIEYILDDGLLIKGSQVLAGRSSKRENTKIGAAKRAVFIDPQHTDEVKKAIEEARPDSILILGTSQRMVELITNKLGIPHPQKIILIEDIASPAEINQALEIREKENRHVIPLPTFALEKEFPGYLLDPIKAFFLGKSKTAPAQVMEHSIVRPVYSSMGNFYLSTYVIEQITIHVISQFDSIIKVKKPAVTSHNSGLIVNLDVYVQYGINIPQLLQKIQQEIKNNLEYLTGLQITKVNIAVRKIILPSGH